MASDGSGPIDLAIIVPNDAAINPDLAHWMYKRGGAKAIEIGSSRAIYMSNPRKVVEVIENAVKAAQE